MFIGECGASIRFLQKIVIVFRIKRNINVFQLIPDDSILDMIA